jgi:Putative inner membrane protein (DUF1819)
LKDFLLDHGLETELNSILVGMLPQVRAGNHPTKSKGVAYGPLAATSGCESIGFASPSVRCDSLVLEYGTVLVAGASVRGGSTTTFSPYLDSNCGAPFDDGDMNIVHPERNSRFQRWQMSQIVAMNYSADITAGSLKIPESRIIADLLLQGVTGKAFQEAVILNNVLQTKNPRTAIRLARLIKQRLDTMQPALWRLVRDGTGTVATHAVLAAAIKHSPLLGDFLDLVVREQHRVFATTLPKRLWDEYLQDCRGRDPDMPLWNESTRTKCGTVVYHILVQAGYLENVRTTKLLAVHVAEPVSRYLNDNDEEYVLRCIQVAP